MTRAAGTEALIEQAEQLEVEAAARSWNPYPEYQDSGVEWLGQVPVGWTIDRLKWTTAGSRNGIWGNEPDGENDIICVRVADFDRTGFSVRIEEPTMRAVLPNERRGRVLQRGDLLIEKSGGGDLQPVGVVVQFEHDESAVCSNFVARVLVPRQFDSRYLAYLHAHLYAGRVNTRSIKQTTGIQNLDATAYFDERVAWPPLPEQRTIAAFLDRKTRQIDELIEKKRRLIDLIQEKRTALISHAVTKGLNPDAPMKPSGIDWLGDVPADVLRLKFLSSFVTSGSRGWAEFYSDEGELFLRIGNVSRISIDLDLGDSQRVTPPDGAEGQRTMVHGGDVLVSVTAYIGSIGVVPERFERAYVNQHLALVRPRRDRIEPRYLAYALFSAVGQVQFRQLMYGGTKEGLGLDDVKNLQVIVPSLAEERAVVAHLDAMCEKLDEVSGAALHAIERLTEYRQAVISAAVTGKIDVREEAEA